MAEHHSTTHGKSHTPEWEAWRSMIKRCHLPTNHNYANYGGRGITVCDRWRESFANFYADMGPRPSGKHSLHRINNDGNYEPGNCEWALATTQANNRRPRGKNMMVKRTGPKALHPANFCDLTGECFGRWTVIGRHGSVVGRNGGATWLCQCECGTQRIVKAKNLQCGRSQSCGCRHKEIAAEIAKETGWKHAKHGLSDTREYAAWNQMLQRCHNPKNPTYQRYGARGVVVCERWRNDFVSFLKDMGPCPSDEHTIDRIDPCGNYEPSNCRWLLKRLQSANRKHVRRFLFNGQMLTIPEISALVGIKTTTLRARIVRRGWSIERATMQNPREYHGHLFEEKAT